jgi:acetyl esterase/lipase
MAIARRGAAVLIVAVLFGIAAATAYARGVMITIHGGAWISTGAAAMAGEAPEAERYASQGWLVHNIDYRPGRYAVRDTLAAYDRIRRLHPRSPICASGDSAGGHLALMVAARRPSLTCAISNAGPTDLVHFPAGQVGDVIHQYLAPYMDLRRWSPALGARRIRQPLLLVYAPYDTVVPYAQGRAMRRAPHAEFVSLRPGMTPWIHTGVDAAALARERRVERAFLARSAGRARSSAAASGRPAR